MRKSASFAKVGKYTFGGIIFWSHKKYNRLFFKLNTNGRFFCSFLPILKITAVHRKKYWGLIDTDALVKIKGP